jgi:hypothetical protein
MGKYFTSFKNTSSPSVYPRPIVIQPSIWIVAPSGFIHKPISCAQVILTTLTLPVLLSTFTSAICATHASGINTTCNSYASSTAGSSRYISELICNGFQAGKQMLIFQVLQTEFQGIHSCCSSHNINLNFPCKCICIVIRSTPGSCSELMNR